MNLRLLLPNATQAVLKHPIDQAADQVLAITGTGGTRGVDVPVAEKPVQVVIT